MRKLYGYAALSGAAWQFVLSFLATMFDLVPAASEALSLAVLPAWVHLVIMLSILWWAYIEEIFFRSWLWRKVEEASNETIAFVTTSVLFAGVHWLLSAAEALLLLPLAFHLGWFRRLGGKEYGVYVSTVCHVSFNVMGFLIGYY